MSDVCMCYVFFFKQKTAYEVRIRDWSSDGCSSDLRPGPRQRLETRFDQSKRHGCEAAAAHDLHPQQRQQPPGQLDFRNIRLRREQRPRAEAGKAAEEDRTRVV